MLFSRFVLVTVEGEHDGLEEGVDFAERDEATQGSNVPGLGLEQKEQVRVLLQEGTLVISQADSRNSSARKTGRW